MNITATLFAQIAAFVVFVWLINHYLWGPLTTALDQRRQRIADGLAAADQGRRDLENAKEQAGEITTQARSKATEIISLAEKRAAAIEEKAKMKAREESERIKQSAQSDIDRQLTQARESLRRQLAEVTIAGAERILQKEVDSAVHAAALKELEERI